jgi:hypothetical protein
MKDQVQALHGKKGKAKEPEVSEAKKDDKAKGGKMTKDDQAKKKAAANSKPSIRRCLQWLSQFAIKKQRRDKLVSSRRLLTSLRTR